MMQSALRDLLVSTPPWVMAGATVDLDFLNSRYYQLGSGGGPSNLITCSRASIGYADDQAGTWYSFASGAPRITNKGLLVEESRTNGIRNNSMQGAIVGTIGGGGAAPTNWSINNATGGLTISISSVTTLNGIDVITFNLSGTTGSGGPFCQIDFEGATSIAALQNQVWSMSQWAQYSNNTKVTGGFLVVQTNAAGGSLLAQDIATNNTTTTFARLSGSVTLANASAAWVKPFLKITFAASSAVNVNVTIGWPQLELGAFVTSPIRTTSAAATRAGDGVTLTKVPTNVGIPVATGFFRGTIPRDTNSFCIFFQADDGAVSNRFEQFRAVDNTTARGITTIASVNGSVAGSAGFTSGSSHKFIYAIASADQAASLDGGAVTTTSNAWPASGINALHIGNNSNTQNIYLNGYVERLALWPYTRLSNADLQRMTA